MKKIGGLSSSKVEMKGHLLVTGQSVPGGKRKQADVLISGNWMSLTGRLGISLHSNQILSKHVAVKGLRRRNMT
jgi:hypothetical protein